MLVYIDIYRQKKNIYIFLAPVCKKFCRPVFIIFLVNAFHNRHCSSNKRSAVVTIKEQRKQRKRHASLRIARQIITKDSSALVYPNKIQTTTF